MMQQQSLFGEWDTLTIPDATVRIQRNFMTPLVSRRYFETLRDETPWQQDKLPMYGEAHNVPRLHCWYGDVEYSWSGVRMKPTPWTYTMRRLQVLTEEALGVRFNSALANYYRNGDDTVGWHADDEPGVGETIASLSFGASRDFCMRRKEGSGRFTILLTAGSLMVMSGRTQEMWEHSIPRREDVGPRINVTFRQMNEAP